MRDARSFAARMWSLIVSALLLGSSLGGSVSAQAPSRGAGDDVTLIRGGTILTVTRGRIENGSILIRGGKIAAVGRNIEAPPGAKVIDARGKYIMPGIIDCHSHIAIDGGVNEGDRKSVV